MTISYSAFHTVLHNSFCRNPADTSSSYDFNSQSEEILDEFGDVVVVRSKPSKSSATAHHHQPSPGKRAGGNRNNLYSYSSKHNNKAGGQAGLFSMH